MQIPREAGTEIELCFFWKSFILQPYNDTIYYDT